MTPQKLEPRSFWSIVLGKQLWGDRARDRQTEDGRDTASGLRGVPTCNDHGIRIWRCDPRWVFGWCRRRRDVDWLDQRTISMGRLNNSCSRPTTVSLMQTSFRNLFDCIHQKFWNPRMRSRRTAPSLSVFPSRYLKEPLSPGRRAITAAQEAQHFPNF